MSRLNFSTEMKAWKNSATLILAAAKRVSGKEYIGNKQLKLLDEGCTAQASLPSSVTKSVGGQQYTSSNYSVLMMQRSGKSSFMPNAHVFPGGIIDRADYSNEWLDVLNPKEFELLSANIAGPRPPMTTYDSKTGIPPDVAFRICAIRETFEESGLLISKDKSGEPSMLGEENTAEWRKRVISDATEFVQLCKEHDIVPNIWELYEWANWLTPATERVMRGNKRRYGTMFYIACLDSIVETLHEEREFVSSKVPCCIVSINYLQFTMLRIDLLFIHIKCIT